MKFDDRELEALKTVLTDRLDGLADPSLNKMLSKDIAYLKLKFFDEEYHDVVIPVQTALRKIIEEIILRRVQEDA